MEKNTNPYSFQEDMIKGRIAETLIEQLFLSMGFSVFRYGMENTIPGIMKFIKYDDSNASRNIRRMPDFVIQDNKNNKVYFVEVRFRKSEFFDRTDNSFSRTGQSFEDYPYKDCYFIVVSKTHIKCITYKELEQGLKITSDSKNYLGYREEFGQDREAIKAFCKFAVKFFANV